MIEQACGYGPGTWNGLNINMVGEVYFCTNGRQVSSPAVRAVMAAASPRIDAYIDGVMKRPEIVAVIEEVSRASIAEENQGD